MGENCQTSEKLSDYIIKMMHFGWGLNFREGRKTICSELLDTLVITCSGRGLVFALVVVLVLIVIRVLFCRGKYVGDRVEDEMFLTIALKRNVF